MIASSEDGGFILIHSFEQKWGDRRGVPDAGGRDYAGSGQRPFTMGRRVSKEGSTTLCFTFSRFQV